MRGSTEATPPPGDPKTPEACEVAPIAWAATALVLVAFVLISESNVGRSYGWDEGAYLASARWVARGQRLFGTVFSSQPPVFLEILAAAFRFFGDAGETAARVSIAFAVLTLISTAWIAHRLYGALAAPIAVLALLSKVFLDQSIIIQAEMPALGLGMLSFALLCSGRRRPAIIALAGMAFALAALSKLWVAPFAIPLAALPFLDRRDDRWRVRPRAEMGPAVRDGLVFAMSGLAVAALVISRYDLSEMYDQVVRLHLVARDKGIEIWGRAGAEVVGRFARKESFVLLLAVVGLVGLARKNPLAAAWLGAWLGVSVLFLLGHAPIFNRHALLMAPPLAILAAGVPNTLFPSRWWPAVLTSALVPLLVLRPSILLESFGWNVPVLTQLPAAYVPDPAEDEVIDLIRQVSRPADLVVSDVPIQVYLAGRDLPPGLVDASGTRIVTGHLTTQEAIAYTSGVGVVVLWGDRLDQLPGYTAWVKERYSRVRKWGRLEERRELYVARTTPEIEPAPSAP